MATYQPPVGYEYDPNTGLYFNQVRAVDENGQNVRVITWFNADTGEYTRDIYPDGVNNAANNLFFITFFSSLVCIYLVVFIYILRH